MEDSERSMEKEKGEEEEDEMEESGRLIRLWANPSSALTHKPIDSASNRRMT